MKKETPFGGIEVFDAHTHFFSGTFFRKLAVQSGDLKGIVDPLPIIGEMTGLEMPPDSVEEFAQVWVAELDENAVSRSVLMASLPGDEGSVAKALELFPDRFSGAYFFDPTVENAVEEATRIFDHLGFSMVCLFPAMHQYSVADNKNVRAIAEVVRQRKGTAIFIHCGALSVGIRGKLGLPSKFDLRFSSPFEVHKLASEFPDVAFIIPHFGAGLWRETLMAADLCENIYIDTSSSNKWVKYESSDVSLEQVFRKTLAILGSERLLFGTDSSVFPRGWNLAVFDEQVEALMSIGVDSAAASNILGGNLRRLLTGTLV